MKYPGSVISRPLLLGLGAVLIVFFIINVSYDIEKKRETEKRREKRKHRQNLDSLLFHPRRNHQGRKSVGNLDWHSGDVIPVFFRKNVKEMKINCEPLFKGSITAQSRARHMKHPRREISPSMYALLTKKCVRFRHYRNYITGPLTSKENKFPVAYSIIMKDSVFQFESLLRAIYRPQNIYCIHTQGNPTGRSKYRKLFPGECIYCKRRAQCNQGNAITFAGRARLFTKSSEASRMEVLYQSVGKRLPVEDKQRYCQHSDVIKRRQQYTGNSLRSAVSSIC